MTDKEKIKKEIERLKQTNGFLPVDNHEICDAYRARGYQLACNDILQFIDSIQEDAKPQFPNYERVVDKVFGAGNLESWEYEEAEKLVLLAKEELLKDLEINKEPSVKGITWEDINTLDAKDMYNNKTE